MRASTRSTHSRHRRGARATGTPAGNKGVGRLASVSDATVSASFQYDAHGRPSAEARQIAGPAGARSYGLSYGFLPDGRLSTVTYPSGRIVTYDYAAHGAPSLLRMRANAGAADQTAMSGIAYRPMAGVSSAGYSELGAWGLSSGTFGNGLSFAVTHNQDGRPTRLLTTGALDLSFAYDASGNIAGVTDAAGARTQTFLYDNLNRLARSVGGYGAIDYTYDKVGNRLSLARAGGAGAPGLISATYAYGATSHKLTTVTAAAPRAFTYLASGQMSGETNGATAKAYSYDAEGRLVLIQTNGATTAASDYDASGQRVSATAAGATTHFIHDPYGRLIAEHNGATGAVLREYVFLGLMPVAMVDYSSGSAVTYYIHADQVMQPQIMTNAAGAVVWNRIADPFGVEVSATGSLTQNLRFPGQYADANGLTQNWMRDYDPLLGRYVQSDPIGLMGGINTYAYVGGNPLMRIDPRGLADYFKFNGETLTGFNTHAPVPFDSDLAGMSGSDPFLEISVPAVSGPWGAGRLFEGLYGGRNLRNRTMNAMMCSDGSGFSLDLDDKGGRTRLRIHPDGNIPGTEGCIGVVCGYHREAYQSIKQGLQSNSGEVVVEVKYP